MAGERRSTRASTRANSASDSKNTSQSSTPAGNTAGTKRKASSGADKTAAATTKKGKKAQVQQTTIESSIGGDGSKKTKDEDVEMKDAPPKQETNGDAAKSNGDGDGDDADGAETAKRVAEKTKDEDADGSKTAKRIEEMTKGDDDSSETANDATTDKNAGDDKGAGHSQAEKAESSAPSSNKSADVKHEDQEKPQQNGFDKLMSNGHDEKEEAKITEAGTGSKVSTSEGAVEDSTKRAEEMPSSVLEKGIIYFFFRGRVGIEEPNSVSDVARSYIVLRPLPQGAKLGEGPIGDAGNSRILALPKKVLPVSPKDRFLTFVEKAKCTMDEIKERFSSSDYATKTVGVRHTPAAAPIGEGVYAITQTGRDTHLAYILTIPEELSDVQKDIGLRQRGSYFTSAKNPESSGPSNVSLPQGAEYPKEIQDEFAGRGWMPLQPRLLEYDNTQFLLIGHKEDALEKAAQPQDGEDQKDNKQTPLEVIEQLEDEDVGRVHGLDGNHAIFADLGLSSKEYPKVQTTW